jgi:Zn-dependent protease
MLGNLFASPLNFLIWALALVIAITIHEFAHAWSADKLGDPTPRSQGRLTLNPLAHLDPLGTLALLLVRFGWGKPVQFDPYNLRHPQRDSALISLAGPASNLILATALSLAIHFLPLPALLAGIFSVIITLNIILAVFNLVPVYPLDGEKIVAGLLPPRLAAEYQAVMRQYGTIILILMLFPIGGISPIAALISPVLDFLGRLLL